MHCDTKAISRFLTDSNPDPALAAHLCVCAQCRRIYEQMRDATEVFDSEAIATGITLSPQQWIYCAALIGGDTFEGMPDVFRHSDNKSRQAAYAGAQDVLASKGLIEVAFDGTVGIRKQLYDIVDTCVNFERFLSLTRRTPGKPERVCNVYQKGGDSIVMYIDIKKGCTAVKRKGKVFFADKLSDGKDAQGEQFAPDALRALCDKAKSFGGLADAKGAQKGLMLAMSGSAEYYSVTEIIAKPGGLGQFRSDTVIHTHEAKYKVVYKPEEKVYAVSLAREVNEEMS